MMEVSPVSEPHPDHDGGLVEDQLTLEMLEVLLQGSPGSGDRDKPPVNRHLTVIRDLDGITHLNLLHDAFVGREERGVRRGQSGGEEMVCWRKENVSD